MPRGRGYVQNAGRRLALAQARQRGRGRGGRNVARGRGRGGGGLGGPSPMPWDSTAQRESAELGNQAADTRANLGAGYSRAQNELGFGEGANNPYSRSAENKTLLESNKRGITNTAGNQLYAGSTLNKQSAARSDYDKVQKGLEDSFADAQNSYTRGIAQTSRDEQLGQLAIKEGAIGRAAASTPAPLGVGGGGRRAGVARGRGRLPGGARAEGQNLRRPGQARQMNARARAINAQVNARNKGRGRR